MTKMYINQASYHLLYNNNYCYDENENKGGNSVWVDY